VQSGLVPLEKEDKEDNDEQRSEDATPTHAARRRSSRVVDDAGEDAAPVEIDSDDASGDNDGDGGSDDYFPVL
jgi:hypothetical protein